jgi:hypothetical protein
MYVRLYVHGLHVQTAELADRPDSVCASIGRRLANRNHPYEYYGEFTLLILLVVYGFVHNSRSVLSMCVRFVGRRLANRNHPYKYYGELLYCRSLYTADAACISLL